MNEPYRKKSFIAQLQDEEEEDESKFEIPKETIKMIKLIETFFE